MINRSIICILFIFIFLINLTYASLEQPYNKKDPILAGVLSWYMAGLGQFYAEKYVKGSIFWVAENSLFVSCILTVADLNFSVDKDIGFQLSVKPKEDISKERKTLGISLGIAYVVFHIYNVVDAIQTVRNLNHSYESENSKRSCLMLDYYNLSSNNFIGMNYSF